MSSTQVVQSAEDMIGVEIPCLNKGHVMLVLERRAKQDS